MFRVEAYTLKSCIYSRNWLFSNMKIIGLAAHADIALENERNTVYPTACPGLIIYVYSVYIQTYTFQQNSYRSSIFLVASRDLEARKNAGRIERKFKIFVVLTIVAVLFLATGIIILACSKYTIIILYTITVLKLYIFSAYFYFPSLLIRFTIILHYIGFGNDSS